MDQVEYNDTTEPIQRKRKNLKSFYQNTLKIQKFDFSIRLSSPANYYLQSLLALIYRFR